MVPARFDGTCPMTLNEIEARLTVLAAKVKADWSLTLGVAVQCCWSAELRWTPRPGRPDGPDRSIVFFSAGGESADDAATAAFYDLCAWRDLPIADLLTDAAGGEDE